MKISWKCAIRRFMVSGLVFLTLVSLALIFKSLSFKEKFAASLSSVRQLEASAVEDPGAEENEQRDISDMPAKEGKDLIDMKIESMTLHEKICQMIITWPEQVSNAETTQLDAEGMEEGLKAYPVGGLIYFGSNLKNPGQTRDMITGTQKAAGTSMDIPLFICVDEEGGNTLRIASNPEFGLEATAAMETMKSEEEVKKAAEYIGNYLKDLGFNFDFAPDADVITNPLNQIIGSRSFGTDADKVTRFSKAYSDGLHEAGILSSYKHFPGHGSTEGDTHEGFAFTNKTLEELRDEDMRPFADAQNAGADSVMVAHISIPNVLGDNTPCTLSKTIITDVLRNLFGYEGLIITDALNMKAITDNYSPAEAAVLTVKAGADIVLMPLDLPAAVEAIKTAVLNGEIDEAGIDASVRRILEKKQSINQ